MKKIFFTLLALVGTMSMNAQKVQVMKIMKNGEVIAKYKAAEADEVVFAEELDTTGTEKRTGDIDVNWVRLWEGGPKFAEYNVGATSATEYGDYYAWGGSQNKVDDHNTANTGSGNLTGTDDTDTNLWGSKWRMPTQAELEGLLGNCELEWTTNYNGTGKNGLLCTGKGAYSSCSVFLPAAGYCDHGSVYDQGSRGYYWSSSPKGIDNAFGLYFNKNGLDVYHEIRFSGCSIRAVLAE